MGMRVAQCWDDGVTSDGPLVDILRRHGARATFNLSAGLHDSPRAHDWNYRGTRVERLGWEDMRALYDGFRIASHSLTHPRLDQMPLAAVRREIIEGRKRLQTFFQQPVYGFAYPFGTYSDPLRAVVRDAGHLYARTIESAGQPWPPADAMAFHPCCHVLAPDFWERYERARAGGVFYFWGHSYELIGDAMWAAFDQTIERISRDPDAQWDDVARLFTEPPRPAHTEVRILKSGF
jgi:peptidoglycan-N-acetylglucosamine deacetylase